MDVPSHKKMIDWKKASREKTQPLPDSMYNELLATVLEWYQCCDIMTVTAPSFHTYDNYPIWEIAKKISDDTGIELVKLFPKKSGKKRMHTFGSLSKKVQDIECEPNKFIFVLDDLFTTGFTLRVSCEAIIKKGSFPCCLAIA